MTPTERVKNSLAAVRALISTTLAEMSCRWRTRREPDLYSGFLHRVIDFLIMGPAEYTILQYIEFSHLRSYLNLRKTK
jgi:hypothetical protein